MVCLYSMHIYKKYKDLYFDKHNEIPRTSTSYASEKKVYIVWCMLLIYSKKIILHKEYFNHHSVNIK
jgi:4-hydroxybenzoate polyprenyltransferase